MSQLSAWLMGGRLAAAEIQVSIFFDTLNICGKTKMIRSNLSVEIVQVGRPDRDCPGGSERLAIIAISPDTIRWETLLLKS